MMTGLRLNSTGILVVMFLAGCVTMPGSDKGPGSALAKRYADNPQISGMSGIAVRKAVSSELKALETALPGTTISWKSAKGVSGEIRPGQAFEISGRICRLLDHRITLNGATNDLSTTACQIEKGNWEPLS